MTLLGAKNINLTEFKYENKKCNRNFDFWLNIVKMSIITCLLLGVAAF